MGGCGQGDHAPARPAAPAGGLVGWLTVTAPYRPGNHPESFSGDMTGDITGEFIRHLGVELTEVTGDRVVAAWEAEARHHQPYGIVHGGVHCSVVETLASVGAAMWLGDQGKVVGVNNNTDFYRAVREGRMTSTATPIHRGRMQQVWLVQTVDTDGRMVARGQVRLQNLYPQD
jgi:1,4-dihydroxy-2-naphthoyl-CoA hydrolase